MAFINTGNSDFSNLPNAGPWGDASASFQDKGTQWHPAIKDITDGMMAITVVGIVISKEGAKTFPSKTKPGSHFNVTSFVIRDSPVDFINVTCFGSKEYVENLNGMFAIGDVIEIYYPTVKRKVCDGQDDKYSPWTPSFFNLAINESVTVIKLYDGPNIIKYTSLKHIPIRAPHDYMSLGDITTAGKEIENDHVNILAIVRKVGPIKIFNTKSGRQATRCEVQLMDDSCSKMFLVIWDSEKCKEAESWQQKNVLSAIDVRANYDEFRKTMILTATSKTIFFINPDTQPSYSLYQFGKTVEIKEDNSRSFYDGDEKVDLDEIKDIYTVSQMYKEMVSGSEDVKYGIIFAFITSLDLDNDSPFIVQSKCSRCSYILDQEQCCTNIDCPNSFGSMYSDPASFASLSLSIRLGLSDHTGTISPCYVKGLNAVEMIGYSPSEYLALTDDQKTELKWKFMFEKCKLHVKIMKSTRSQQKISCRALSFAIADPQEALRYAR